MSDSKDGHSSSNSYEPLLHRRPAIRPLPIARIHAEQTRATISGSPELTVSQCPAGKEANEKMHLSLKRQRERQEELEEGGPDESSRGPATRRTPNIQGPFRQTVASDLAETSTSPASMAERLDKNLQDAIDLLPIPRFSVSHAKTILRIDVNGYRKLATQIDTELQEHGIDTEATLGTRAMRAKGDEIIAKLRRNPDLQDLTEVAITTFHERPGNVNDCLKRVVQWVQYNRKRRHIYALNSPKVKRSKPESTIPRLSSVESYASSNTVTLPLSDREADITAAIDTTSRNAYDASPLAQKFPPTPSSEPGMASLMSYMQVNTRFKFLAGGGARPRIAKFTDCDNIAKLFNHARAAKLFRIWAEVVLLACTVNDADDEICVMRGVSADFEEVVEAIQKWWDTRAGECVVTVKVAD